MNPLDPSLPVPDSPEALESAAPSVSGAPTEDEWKLVDFMRSQTEKLFQSGNYADQARLDQTLQSFRIAFERMGFPIHDPRALHTALLVTATLSHVIAEHCSECLLAAHTYDDHMVPAVEHFQLLLRSLLQGIGVRPPIKPAPGERAPSGAIDGNTQQSPTWEDLEGEG